MISLYAKKSNDGYPEWGFVMILASMIIIISNIFLQLFRLCEMLLKFVKKKENQTLWIDFRL